MTDTVLLDALAMAYADNLNTLLSAEVSTNAIKVIEDGLTAVDPDWRDNIDPTISDIVGLAEAELHDLAQRLPRTLTAELQWGARRKTSGVVLFFDGLLDSKEAVQDAINIAGRAEDFEVVRRGVTKWMPVK